MKLDDGYLRFSMAVLTCVSVCIVAAEVIAPGQSNLEAFLRVIKGWQGLLGGAFTLLAAGYAANYVVAQMRHAQALEDARVARARRAWLAMMPEAMSAVCGYATKSYLDLVDQHAIATQPTGLTSANNPVREVPQLNEAIFPEIRSMIENAGSPTEADEYAELLSQIQVHRVRWRGRLDELSTGYDKVLPFTLQTEIVCAAELYARASNLLGAARPVKTPDDLKPVSRIQALKLLGGSHLPIDAVETIAERWDRLTPLIVP